MSSTPAPDQTGQDATSHEFTWEGPGGSTFRAMFVTGMSEARAEKLLDRVTGLVNDRLPGWVTISQAGQVTHDANHAQADAARQVEAAILDVVFDENALAGARDLGPVGDLVIDEDRIQVWAGKCVDVIAGLPPDSVDSVVTDPPYNLTGGKKGGSGPASVNLDSPYGRSRIGTGNGTGGFMGEGWDDYDQHEGGFQGWCTEWATECFRVLKPGGYLVAFGSPRTSHRLAAGIEDAGFQIRDGIAWVYASGFPKSMNVGAAVAKATGTDDEDGEAETEWDGWGTALKPAYEPIVVARKPFPGTVARNVLQHRTGALNIDGCRVATSDSLGGGAEKATTAAQKGHDGWTRPWMDDEAAREAHAARVRDNVAKAEELGRWPSNLVLTHTPDCVPAGTRKVKAITGTNSGRGAGTKSKSSDVYGTYAGRSDMERGAPVGLGGPDGTETVEAWNCAEGCPVAELDAQTGAAGPVGQSQTGSPALSLLEGEAAEGVDVIAAGGASRFFPTFPAFRFAAKAPARERPVVKSRVLRLREDLTAEQVEHVQAQLGETDAREDLAPDEVPSGLRDYFAEVSPEAGGHIAHPTVKSLELTRWLVRLVTPPGGKVLEPFAGSGTTVEAAWLEGFSCTAVEKTAKYVPLIRSRLDRHRDPVAFLASAGADLGLFDVAAASGDVPVLAGPDGAGLDVDLSPAKGA